MTYNTNHSGCSTSNWNNESFHGEVIVSVSEFISTDSILDTIPDPDFNSISQLIKFVDATDIQERVLLHKELAEEKNIEFDEVKFLTEMRTITKESLTLKANIIDWLNENVKDRIVHDENTDSPLADKKGWAIGNDKFNSYKTYSINIFFARQVDALKFIRKFSIFQVPTFYFDYFHSDRRELTPKNIIDIINDKSNMKVDFNSHSFINHRSEPTSNNLDPHSFRLLDWEKNVDEEYCSFDADMTSTEIQAAVAEINSVI
jgi:hypothetical protein